MNQEQLYEWLYDNGGTFVRYRTAKELLRWESSQLAPLFDDVLHDKLVVEYLGYFDTFRNLRFCNNKIKNSVIHNGKITTLENFFPKLVDMGLHAGVSILDEQVQPLRKFYSDEMFLWICDLKSKTKAFHESNQMVFAKDHVSAALLYAGYQYEELIDYVKQRLDCYYQTLCHPKFFDFINTHSSALTEEEKFNLLPDECRHGFPSIRGIIELAYFPKSSQDSTSTMKINRVIDVIMDYRYQCEGGLDSLLAKRFNSFTSWLPHLPGYFGEPAGQQATRLLIWLDIMSQFDAVRKTKWFNECIAHLEGFRTPEGTYLFPKEYLRHERFGYYISGFIMGLEKGRNKRSLEIESTFRMSILKARAGL